MSPLPKELGMRIRALDSRPAFISRGRGQGHYMVCELQNSLSNKVWLSTNDATPSQIREVTGLDSIDSIQTREQAAKLALIMAEKTEQPKHPGEVLAEKELRIEQLEQELEKIRGTTREQEAVKDLGVSREELRTILDDEGIEYDGRWADARLMGLVQQHGLDWRLPGKTK